jgi:hypothetical protein
MIDELHVKQNILQSDIDIVVNNLCDLFSKSSSYVFGTVNKKPRNRNSSNKPWYNASFLFIVPLNILLFCYSILTF